VLELPSVPTRLPRYLATVPQKRKIGFWCQWLKAVVCQLTGMWTGADWLTVRKGREKENLKVDAGIDFEYDSSLCRLGLGHARPNASLSRCHPR
jgi:hypothetical protein